MLSVLIPSYNWDVTSLVSSLVLQLEVLSIDYEVLVVDDASDSDVNLLNETINTFDHCSFVSLSSNLGRSELRNYLADSARYSWLLFLDADVLPTTKTFLATYLHLPLQEDTVYVGGIAYCSATSSRNLRWKQGVSSEELPIHIRSNEPYKFFFTGNFLIHRSVFNLVQFDDSLKKYGYEDLLFAKNLQRNCISIQHVINPVFHLGLDSNIDFLEKTKQALANLAFLVSQKKIDSQDLRLLRVYERLSVYGLPYTLSLLTPIYKQLAISFSSLFFFQLYRLAYLHQMFKKL